MKTHLRYVLVATLLLTILQSDLVSAQGCTGFRTLTERKWGVTPLGNNPAAYMHANFAAAFPGGLTIGCGSGNTLTLTTAQAITDFLPYGSSLSVLPAGAMVDPGSSYNNRFAGHLVAATLNAGFDSYDPNFGTNAQLLGSLTIVSGPFAGWTVSQLLAEANNTIGGCSNTYSLHALNKALMAINTNYPNSNTDNGYLTCSACNIVLGATAVNPTCYSNENGSIDVTVTGAAGTVAYLWNDGVTTQDRNGLAAGTYTVTATDAGNCSSTISKTIIKPPLFSVTGVVTNVSITSGSDGAINTTVPGGIPEYQYLWSDGAITADRTGLTAGIYVISVTDGNGCPAQRSFLVSQPKCNLSIVSNMAANASCNGCADGTIDVILTGAQGNVTYLWNNGASTASLFGLAAGTYVLTATDEGNCITILSDSIGEPQLKNNEIISGTTFSSVSIFPNPASDQFVIAVETNNSSTKRMSVEIRNLVGQVVYIIQPRVFNSSLKIPVDISGFASGSYITRVTVDGKEFFKQLEIQH